MVDLPVVQSIWSWQEPQAALAGFRLPVIGVRCRFGVIGCRHTGRCAVAGRAVSDVLREGNFAEVVRYRWR